MPLHPGAQPYAGDQSWWAGGGWHIVPILLFVILIGVIVWAVLRVTSGRSGSGAPRAALSASSDAALAEVRVRYARGEMSREEFVQRFHDLGGTGLDEPTPPSGTTPPAPTPPDATPPAAA